MLYGKRALLPLKGQQPPALWRTPLPKDWDDTAAWAEALRQRAELYQLMLPAAKEHLQAAQDRDKRRHSSRTHDSSGVPWQRHPYREGDFVYLPAPTPEHPGDGQGAANSAGAPDHQFRWAGAPGRRWGPQHHRAHTERCTLLAFPGGPSPEVFAAAPGQQLQRGGGGEWGPSGGHARSWGVFSNQRPPTVPCGSRGSGGNGHQELGRFARSYGELLAQLRRPGGVPRTDPALSRIGRSPVSRQLSRLRGTVDTKGAPGLPPYLPGLHGGVPRVKGGTFESRSALDLGVPGAWEAGKPGDCGRYGQGR